MSLIRSAEGIQQCRLYARRKTFTGMVTSLSPQNSTTIVEVDRTGIPSGLRPTRLQLTQSASVDPDSHHWESRGDQHWCGGREVIKQHYCWVTQPVSQSKPAVRPQLRRPEKSFLAPLLEHSVLTKSSAGFFRSFRCLWPIPKIYLHTLIDIWRAVRRNCLRSLWFPRRMIPLDVSEHTQT